MVRIEDHNILFTFGFHDLGIAILRYVVDIIFRVFRRLPVRRLNADPEGVLCFSLLEGIALGIQDGNIIGQEDGFTLDQIGFQHHRIGHRSSSLRKHTGNQDNRCILRRLLQGCIGVDHRLDGLLGQNQFRVLLRLVRNQTVAQNHRICQFIFQAADGIAHIALDGMQESILHTCHQAHVVRKAVAIVVKEDQITGNRQEFAFLGERFRRSQVKFPLLQFANPFGAAALQGDHIPGNLCIMQAEGGKHRAPVTVGDSVPLAVAGIALDRVILFHQVVPGAFRIAELAFCHGYNVLHPAAGKLRQGLDPLRFPFQICGKVRKAAQIVMDMGFQFTNQRIRALQVKAEAVLSVLMEYRLQVTAEQRRFGLRFRSSLGDFADQHRILGFIAVFFVLMTLDFLLGADQQRRFLQAAFPMGMARKFFLGTDQIAFRVKTGFAVLMTLGFFQGTDQVRFVSITVFFAVLMTRLLLLGANQDRRNRLVAVLSMFMGSLDFLTRLRQGVAAFRMLMHCPFRQGTNQYAGSIVAVILMAVDQILIIAADHKPLVIQTLRTVDMDLYRAGKDFFHLPVTGLFMFMLFHAAGRLSLLRNRRQDQRIGGTEHHNGGHGRHNPLPAFFVSAAHGVPAHLLIYLFVQITRHVPFCVHIRHSRAPAVFRGQTRKTILPTICSFAIQPTAVLRESTDVARWSPITKIRFSGT